MGPGASGSNSALLLPGLQRLRGYQPVWFRGDLLAGLTVAAYLIPQCMAYAELAGVAPVAGLWAILPPMLLYALIGSSPQLSVGPESTTAVMTAAAIGPMAAGDAGLYASLLALVVGGICFLGAWGRLGFLADLLSKPILVGYMAGVAVIMIGGQIGKISGLSMEADGLLNQVLELVRRHGEIHGPTLLLAIGVLLFLLLIQRRYPQAPGPLLAVLLAVAAVSLLDLEQRGVSVIGTIPAGLPSFALPEGVSPDKLKYLLSTGVGIALVGYSDNVLTARAFAARGGYRIDANQELLALGAANLGNVLMQGFAVSSSGSRTAIGDSLGSRSQLFSLVAFLVVVLVLLFLRPVLALFPKAALGAIVIYAALRLIDIPEFQRMRRFKLSEFRLALITCAGVLLTDILVGVGLAVALSVVDLFARLVRPHDAVLGNVPNLAGLHDVDDWEGATTLPGLVLYRYDAPLCFANAEDFRRRALGAIAAEHHPVQWFVLNAEAIVEIDITAVDMLLELQEELSGRGIVMAMARVKQGLYQQLLRAGVAERIGADRSGSFLRHPVNGDRRLPGPGGGPQHGRYAMSLSDRFIRGPVLTTVCSLVILIMGAISIPLLPLEKLPQLAPTQINVSAVNIGADARTTVDTVTNVLEEEINGVEDMKYMYSNTSSDGVANITVAFPVAVDRNIAQVNVQNRVSKATPGLPDVVKQTGVTVEAASPSLLLAFGFYSDTDAQGQPLYDPQFISNYIDRTMVDEVRRIPGIGNTVIIGERKFALRIWLDPLKLAANDLTPLDVERALKEQNI
ncbi:MAG: sulfate permease [Synechococcus sp.]